MSESVISAIEIANGVWGNVQGGVEWSSAQATFPSGLDILDAQVTPIETQAARFYCHGDFDAYDTIFVAKGKWATVEVGGESVTAFIDVHLELHHTIHTVGSLSFKAAASDVFLGTNQDPRIGFRIDGEFDPLGYGSCGFNAEIEVDTWGQVVLKDSKVTEGWGDLYATGTEGFVLHVHSEVLGEALARAGLNHETVSGWFTGSDE